MTNLEASPRLAGTVFLVLSVFLIAPSPVLFGGPAFSMEVVLPVSGVVEIRKGLLTVDAHNIPLKDLLRIIGEKVSVGVDVRGDFEARITDSFSDVPLHEGIQRVLRGHSFAVSYRAHSDEISHVWVLGSAAAQPGQRRVTEKPIGPSNGRDLRTVSIPNDNKQVAELADLLSTDKNPLIRKAAAAGLGSTGRREAAEELRKSLTDSSPAVRTQALLSLGHIAGTEAVRDLYNVLTTDQDPDVRRAAVVTLSGLPSEDSRWAIEAAANDSDETIRRQVPSAIERWKKQVALTRDRSRN